MAADAALLLSADATYFTGQLINIDGGKVNGEPQGLAAMLLCAAAPIA